MCRGSAFGGFRHGGGSAFGGKIVLDMGITFLYTWDIVETIDYKVWGN
jgi:hypothetical protein